eukprot:sb/3465302/
MNTNCLVVGAMVTIFPLLANLKPPPSDSPDLTVPSPSIVYGEVLVATLTTTYLSSSPSVHWTVNGVRTSATSSTTSGSTLTSQLRWPATVDLEVTATVHHYDIGRVAMATKHVTVYGVERVDGPDVAVVGGSYNLTCVVDTRQEVEDIVWTLDGEMIGVESVQEIAHTDNKIHSVLTLPYLSVADYGVYICGAEFSDGSLSSYTHHLVQSTDCAVPDIPNAVYPGGSAPTEIIGHTGTLEVVCGEDTIVMQCQLGSWDTRIVACPAISEALMIQLITGICVLVVCVVVALTALLLYKKNRRERSVSPEARPDSVMDFKMRLQSDGYISNPVLQSTTIRTTIGVGMRYNPLVCAAAPHRNEKRVCSICQLLPPPLSHVTSTSLAHPFIQNIGGERVVERARSYG